MSVEQGLELSQKLWWAKNYDVRMDFFLNILGFLQKLTISNLNNDLA